MTGRNWEFNVVPGSSWGMESDGRYALLGALVCGILQMIGGLSLASGGSGIMWSLVPHVELCPHTIG